MKWYIIDRNSKIYGEATTLEKADCILNKVIQRYRDKEWTDEEIVELELEVIKC